ncbi:MAG: hypothetical protein IJN53_06750 [Oscillospiraceae bacterium]|nr:hypothetical protein [Oscillospiraceae bacterium]
MDKNCASCTGCSGNCGGCSGCGSSLVLSGEEIAVLRVLEQVAFLPAARKADTMDAVCLEEELAHIPQVSQALALLEKKALIDLDYRSELKGFDYAAYSGYPCRGSMALTQRGQAVVELLEVQGAQD